MAMQEAGIERMVVYGNAWQGDYLRYAADFGILEGHGIALVSVDGAVELFLDSASRSRARRGGSTGRRRPSRARYRPRRGARLDRIANHRMPPRRAAFCRASWPTRRGFALEDGTALLDRLLMHKIAGRDRGAAARRALADEAYDVFRKAALAGRRQYELVAEVEGLSAQPRLSRQFHDHRRRAARRCCGMTPPSDRRIAHRRSRHHRADAGGRRLLRADLPHARGRQGRARRSAAPSRVYREALEAGIAAVRPGATAADVARAENDVFRKHGLGEYVTSQYTRVRGHGLGLFVRYQAAYSGRRRHRAGAGMVLIVHPNTYHPDVGYMVLGDAVVVTETGAEVLIQTPRELFEVPA